MGMDAYALKFKNLVKFDDVKHLFDQYGDYLEWTEGDFRRLDYTNQRIKAWVQTIPGFDESIHTHQFTPNVDPVETLKANGIDPDSDFEVVMFSDDILMLTINERGTRFASSSIVQITSDNFKYEPTGEWWAYVQFTEEGYIRKPFQHVIVPWSTTEDGGIVLSANNFTGDGEGVSKVLEQIDAKQADEANMYFVSQAEIAQITPYVNEYDRKTWTRYFDQPNTIVHLNW